MKSKDPQFHVVARAVRMEHNAKSDSVYLVFEIVDEKFKQRIKNDWTQDIELQVLGKELVLPKE